MVAGEKLEWFGVVSVSDPGTGRGEVVFRARYAGRDYTAYGRYESADDYAVVHGPTQADVDLVSALLDDGYEPSSEVTAA